MNKAWFLFLVIPAASLPVIPAWFYFRSRKLDGFRFLACLGAGFVSVFIALTVQRFFPSLPGFARGNIAYIFIRIALIEELSRLVVLFPAAGFFRRGEVSGGSANPRFGGMEAGLIAGLGFAAAESVFYAAIDPASVLLRAISAAPLHGACGARTGSAVDCMRRIKKPRASGLSFEDSPSGLSRRHFFGAAASLLSSVLIHGIYDWFIISPAAPSFLALLLAFAAFGSSLMAIRHSAEN